ncbi:hypothetical protein GDO81_003959 [Engystomops pustulosus]|uniref:Uncharacterized protein n=1 Tax=Engystomops pustulosus TaxID=76066 RepID=A0AAV7AA61_ENGPU|nr:hypothetical protein GDO81_003959 [Engystomops pustulosus]
MFLYKQSLRAGSCPNNQFGFSCSYFGARHQMFLDICLLAKVQSLQILLRRSDQEHVQWPHCSCSCR